MFELKRVTVEILNDGSYDGMKHLTFPIRIENCIDYGIEVGMVDVPLYALIEAGYDKVKGNLNPESPDCAESDVFLCFTYGECRIVD
ncbi:hypothetical protein HYL88_004630 [Salmonella enterica subsp. enterica serovar Infantis]|uniref:hypothetical protein n=1 Tax=Salmonella enterica TaxID=28901 RepID=UPI00190A17FC|nr:hypothetical protein [Salmonella enterica]EFR5313970.1 hypothetical protein [Salmonella enterica subsp. enterica serovar Typhimurium]EFR5223074.1 hypothetical protein [Salmonella enterica subsp. enterica serovar Infantis]EFR5271523.1 hypothetical protein [Salmonella enterica subsp. enterica serovar Infantis]EFR5276537.1 hypothetical protein [Salmonella enterica subsp. enterica serovar Infantis]EFR5335937.1 hypothetical protein [Salmonella enterica subsp. enterica serovar Infantis]